MLLSAVKTAFKQLKHCLFKGKWLEAVCFLLMESNTEIQGSTSNLKTQADEFSLHWGSLNFLQ